MLDKKTSELTREMKIAALAAMFHNCAFGTEDSETCLDEIEAIYKATGYGLFYPEAIQDGRDGDVAAALGVAVEDVRKARNYYEAWGGPNV